MGVIIETVEAVENLDEILAVPDLGFVFIGHRDQTISLGHRNDADHPHVHETIDRIRSACLETDLPVGRVPADRADARAAIDEGFQLFLLGYEPSAVRDYFGRWVGGLESARTGK